jgi:hypothetical protein
MGTPHGNLIARTSGNGGYEPLRVANIYYAIVDAMKNPPAGFESAVQAHFQRKRSYITGVAHKWMVEVRLLVPVSPRLCF